MNLVFASGFLFPQSLLGIDYFRGIRDHIGDAHATAFPLLPPLASAEERARILADKIAQAFPSGAIHIIAHSMAGLDSRIVIGANRNGLSAPGRIASLTTLSTPHRGSPVADLLAGPRPNDARRVIYDGITAAFSRAGLDVGALASLTAERASATPDVARTHPHIRYRSYFASGRPDGPPTCVPLLATHQYIQDRTGQPNDGLVARDSAVYGELQQPFWPCDHADMVGHNLDTLDLGFFRFDHFTAIDAIISGL